MVPLRPEVLTWTALLSRWIEFAQASLALPDDATGEAWRRSVPHVINLQAVTFALGDLATLPPEERGLARDKAEVLIDRSEHGLRDVWSLEALPPSLAEILDDARLALHAAGNIA